MTDSTTGKTHLLIDVPDFAETTFPDEQDTDKDGSELYSFLRMGSFDYDREPPRAKELLALIPQVTSAIDATESRTPSQIHDAIPAGIIFADDVRKRAQDKGLALSDDPDHMLSHDRRAAESSLLYVRGGWRDHSDGNRISTTYGDKVEVVRGNYKMIVMGRQDKPGQAMGWDVGGAHIQDYAPGTMPGASQFLEWIPDERYFSPDGQKGVWLLVNTTENVYEYARNAGNFREENWGDVHEAYVGSENPASGSTAFATDDTTGTEGHLVPAGWRIAGRSYDRPTGGVCPAWADDNNGMVRSNPHIIERTWAERIDSWTGSKKCPVPLINERTYAVTTDEIVDVTDSTTSDTKVGKNVAETSWVGGNVSEKSEVKGDTKATTIVHGKATEDGTFHGGQTTTTHFHGAVMEESHFNKGMTGLTFATGHITETTNVAGAKSDFTNVAAMILETTAVPVKIEAAAHALAMDFSAKGVALEIAAGIAALEFKLFVFQFEAATGYRFTLASEEHEIKIQKHQAGVNDDKKWLFHKRTGLKIDFGI